MRVSIRSALLILLLLGLFAGAGPARAQDEGEVDGPSGLTMAVSAGYDGFYKQQSWVPVQVALQNEGPSLEGFIRIEVNNRGVAGGDLYEVPVSLPTRSNKVLQLQVYLLTFTSRITVTLHTADGRVVSRAFSNELRRMDNDALLYGVVSDAPGELAYLETAAGTRGRAEVGFLTLDALQEVIPAWQALDILVLDGIDTGRLTPDSAPPSRPGSSRAGSWSSPAGPAGSRPRRPWLTCCR